MTCRSASLLILMLLLAATLSACATMPPDAPALAPQASAQADDVNDPLESWNRRVFNNNDFFDRLLVRPLAELYRATIPPGIRDRLADLLNNMKEPVIFANDMMQGRLDSAGTTLERFGINTTLGVGGMWDVADAWDMPQQTGDFGQTLASWGVGEGPYLMMPVFGPSNLRDAIGRGVDIALSPWQYLTLMNGTGSLIRYEASYFTASVITHREHYIEASDALRADSLDYYAAVRSAYRQRRARQLGLPAAQPEPKFDEDQQ